MVSGSSRSGILGCGAGSLANRLPSPVVFWLTNGWRPVSLPGEDVAQERSARPEVALPASPVHALTCEEDDVSAVMIAVDPHKAGNTAAVLDPVTKTLLESARFTSAADGYGQLARFAGRWERRRWAVEGCFGVGRSLAQRTGRRRRDRAGRARQARGPGPRLFAGPWPQDRQR